MYGEMRIFLSVLSIMSNKSKWESRTWFGASVVSNLNFFKTQEVFWLFFHLKSPIRELNRIRSYVSHTLLFYYTVFIGMKQQYIANTLSVKSCSKLSDCIHGREKRNEDNRYHIILLCQLCNNTIEI